MHVLLTAELILSIKGAKKLNINDNFYFQQEHERRCRTKDLEIERLKQKLAHIAEKERETNARNRQIISQIKSGDVSFVNDNLQVRTVFLSFMCRKHSKVIVFSRLIFR